MPSSDSTTSEAIQYLIQRSTDCMKNGEFSFAKSYLMTANVLDSENISIKYQTYSMCRTQHTQGKCNDSTEYFGDLFCNATSTDKISKKDKQNLKNWFMDEMKNILFAIKEQWQMFTANKDIKFFHGFSVDKISFYKQLFHSLNDDDQFSCLTRYINYISNDGSESSVIVDLLLYVLERFGLKSFEIAEQLIKIKDKLEQSKDSNDKSLTEFLRQRYILNILPVLFSSNSAFLPGTKNVLEIRKHFFNVLRQYVEDYIIKSTLKDAELLFNNENRRKIEEKLIEMVLLIAKNKKWTLFQNSNLNLDNLESSLPIIESYTSKLYVPIDLSSASSAVNLAANNKKSESEEILFFSLVLFVLTFSKYYPKQSVFVEKLHCLGENQSFLPTKKRKLITYEPNIVAPNNELLKNFAILTKLSKVFEEFIKQDFEDFIKLVNLVENDFYQQYQIDLLIYKAHYNIVDKLFKPELLKLLPNNFADCISLLKFCMQYVSIFVKQNDYIVTTNCLTKIADLLLSSIKPNFRTFAQELRDNNNKSKSNLDDQELLYCDANSSMAFDLSSGVRQLIFLPLSFENVIAFLVDASISVLKDATLSNVGLGHLIVLSQFAWPYYYNVFVKAIGSIVCDTVPPTANIVPAHFVYPQFHYIRIPDIIEEFMSLCQDGKIVLVIKPNVNSNVINDISSIRSILIQQMSTSLNVIPYEFFIQFFHDELKPYFYSNTR